MENHASQPDNPGLLKVFVCLGRVYHGPKTASMVRGRFNYSGGLNDDEKPKPNYPGPSNIR